MLEGVKSTHKIIAVDRREIKSKRLGEVDGEKWHN